MFRLLLTLLVLVFPAQAFALSGEWKKDDTVAVRLISGVAAVGKDATVPLGLEIQLTQGWHTYWRSPGQAGLPPGLDWSRSENDEGNVQSAVLLYPAPSRYSIFGMETIGYHNYVLFPIDATLRTPGRALSAEASVDFLVCLSTCLPEHFDVSISVPEGEALESEEAPMLHRARAKIPTSERDAGLFLKGAASDGESLTFYVQSKKKMTKPDVFVENEKKISFGAPEVAIEPPGYSATLTVRPVDTLPEGVTLATLPLTLTLVQNGEAAEIQNVLPSVFSTPDIFIPQLPPFVFVLFCALVGGLILNFMPCVLPVLSLKIVGLVGHGGGDKGRVQQSFLMTGAGVIFSFLVLAGLMTALKEMELALGWGVQFQQPVFLMFLCLLLTFFAANLWGFYEIALPRFLADRMAGSYRPKLAGDFATGAFATLLATPCSAPFLGTAVGFALGSGVGDIFAVFSVLGLGMALPYFLVAVFPGAATLLPKPGAWMIRLRQFLGFVLALTVFWLVWVMSAQITVSGAASFALMLGALLLVLALRKHGFSRKMMIVGASVVSVLALFVGIDGALEPKGEAPTERQWMSYSPASLRADIAEGKTVFLDVTADWCLTCKANKIIAFSNAGVVERLFHSSVVAMQANWTNPDPEIMELLHKNGRYGIPFNIVYGPGAPQGIVLPELLSPKTVLDALDKAERK